ncbi:AcrR family transcriptional regulator [Amycolatopsis bartoniae]|uniref:TetR family transcriptional regulator n=1 Tax=Amycolatopsis bartoniae TaxID=941986 RepID=A0A8H9MBN4_9PSEU|nr:TetR family transcriptional regulator [Amycolatopsis bartoniae]MBB2934493.1 AcrR family transcriptional regulator [Amycolatopsis bartoniae]GHF47001.1 TetR family transcriptional regulator [Amycolatopsis bartoniae]
MGRPPEPERRAGTLAAATDYVLARGLAGLSLRPLAAALGTSTRMLQYDFGSKENLVAEILAEIRRREAVLLADAIGEVGDAPADLVRGVWAWLTAPEREQFLKLFFEVYVDAVNHPDRYPQGGRAMVTDWLNPLSTALGGDGKATLTIAVVRGLLLDRFLTGDEHRTDEALEQFAASLR